MTSSPDFLAVIVIFSTVGEPSCAVSLSVNGDSLENFGYYLVDSDTGSGFALTNFKPAPDSYTQMGGSGNGGAGGELLDEVIQQGGKPSPDLGDVIDSLDDIFKDVDTATPESDRLLAAVAGAGVSSLGSAALSNVEAQLMRIRNWGGSVGADWGIADNCSLGFAFTALYGDLNASSIDSANGDLDSYYLSLAAQHQSGNWQHHAIMSWGLMDASLDRHVSHANGSYSTSGDTGGYSFGLMYELGYHIKLSESSTLIPTFNAALVHSYLDAYTESGSDAALRVSEQSNTIATFGIGARFERKLDFGLQIGARALLKIDAGDRAQEAEVSLASVAGSHATVQGTEAGPAGIELGVGASMPVGENSAIFFDASADLREEQQNCNATVGYSLRF